MFFTLNDMCLVHQDAIMKANARTKKWLAYSVVGGSLIVLTISGLLVGLYLNGSLNRQAQEVVRPTMMV